MKNLDLVRHLLRWLLLFVASSFLAPLAMQSLQPATTQINDVIYRADGTRASGTLLISWPAFSTPDKQAVAAGSKSVHIAGDGSVSISLVPTAGSIPAGTFYKIVAKFDDGTTSNEYWSVPATPTATIAGMRISPAVTSGSVAFQASISAKLDRIGDTPVTMAGVRYASQFPGTTVVNKLDAAIADCSGKPCVVVAPPTLDSGSPTSLPDNVTFIDQRQSPTMNALGMVDYGQHTGIEWRRRITTTSNNWAGYSGTRFYLEVAKGGHNDWNGSSSTKNTFNALEAFTVSRSKGQTFGSQIVVSNFGSGDTVSSEFDCYRYGGTLTPGDEGIKCLRITGGSGSTLFSANVTSVNGNVLTFSGASNANTLGETRTVINRNPAKQHVVNNCSVNGNTPPVVTCTDASLASWYGGTGPKNNVCFELTAAKIGIFNRTVRLRSIDSETAALLDFQHAGLDAAWSALSPAPTTGRAVFSNCSPATDVSTWDSNKMSVADGSAFAPGDAIEQNVAPEQAFTGLNIIYYPSQWPNQNTYGITINNNGTYLGGPNAVVPMNYGISTTGDFRQLWRQSGIVTDYGLNFYSPSVTPPGAGWFVANSAIINGCENVVATKNSTLNSYVGISYCRHPSDADARGWRLGPLAVTEDARIGLGFGGWAAQPGRQFFLVATGNNDTFYSYQGTSGSTGAAFKSANNAWMTGWQVDHAGNAKHFNGSKLSFYSDSGNTPTATIDGSTGIAQFSSVCYNSARTLCDYAGTGAPSSSCSTGSTYRRSDGGPSSTFYVCEAGSWTAK